jgi:hypothetical protein
LEENLGIFYVHLVYFTAIGNILGTAIGNILWPFGIFCGNLVYFPRFGILDQGKSGNPGLRAFFRPPLPGKGSKS